MVLAGPEEDSIAGPDHFNGAAFALAEPDAFDALGTDLDDHALLARSEVGILVLAQVLLGEHVDVVQRPVLDDRGWAADHHVAGLLVFGGQDGDRRSRVALDVFYLRPPAC